MIAAGRAHGLTPSVQRLLITICVMMATIMQVLDITIANVSLPYMQGSLSATLDQVSWVLTSYVVAAAVMTAPVGWLAARFGIKKLLVACVTGFTVASMLCGIAQSIEEIVVFRVVQGMFGAALVPLSQTVMLQTYPPERRAWAMSLWGMGVMIGPIMGPILGGWLTESYSWRWIFFINLPFGIATTLGLLAFMDETEGDRALSFDWLGFAALSVSIGALQLMLDRGEQLGWFDSTEIIVTALVSAAGFYVFIAHSLTTPKPFISIEIFRDRNFVVGLMFMFICGVLLVASMALMAPLLQGVMGYPIIDAGLLLGTRGIGMAFAMLTAGRLMARIDPRLVLAAGLACCTVSLYYSMDFGPNTAVHTIVWISLLQGFGLGFMFVPLNTIALSSLQPQLLTQGTAMWTLIRNLGSSIGVSIVIANLTNKTILMHARLAESVTPFNQGLADPAAAMLDPRTEVGRALLEQLMTQQATIIAYANDFKLMMVMTILAFPLILLLRVRGLFRQPAAAAPAD
ncbi:MAG: DHA2 family efflux MFS transporter permease subunit [Hyphomonadaceae bacterium]|jgi:DHA2 family multidrug resistance protein|nr:DHA2 family efflux MFS transporter permease subunit [Hyphomonadaceae bacterium]